MERTVLIYLSRPVPCLCLSLRQSGPEALHVRLAAEADTVCIAPATADFLARAASGRADDRVS